MTSLKKSSGRKAVLILASSGGGTATLGHTDAPTLLQTIHDELLSIQGDGAAYISHALFVSLLGGKGMDAANKDVDAAVLYRIDSNTKSLDTTDPDQKLSCRIAAQGTLKHVNESCRTLDTKLAEKISAGEIHGLICISCHTGIFQQTLAAAAARNLPVTGSGGTSLSQAAALYGIRLVGNAGGSVATTTFTRAVSYTHALASYWRLPYEPWNHTNGCVSRSGPTVTSVLNACLPAFWGVCITKFVLQTGLSICQDASFKGSNELYESVKTLIQAVETCVLPTACAVIMATQAGSNRDKATSSLIMAAVIGSVGCRQLILAGLLVGLLVARWSERLLFFCIFNNVPATMTNLITSGGIGGCVALTTFPAASILRQVTGVLRDTIMVSVSVDNWRLRAASGFVWGCLSCYGSKVGWYHAFHLPLILVEMELGQVFPMRIMIYANVV